VRAKPGESPRATAVLEAGGIMVTGPYPARHGMTIDADVETGAVHLAIVCHADAEAIAQAFVAGAPPPASRALAEKTVRGKASLHARGAACPVAVVASSVTSDTRPSIYHWQRPVAEAGAELGGPPLQCAP
jgi:hypothetical protein